METFTNDKGEEIVIADMDNHRLVNSIAKYADVEDTVKALKKEAVYRLYASKRIMDLMDKMEEDARDNEEDPSAKSKAIYKGLELALGLVSKKSNSDSELPEPTFD